MITFLKDMGWFAMLVLSTSILAAVPVRVVAKVHGWRTDQYRKWISE
jgi:hypothetical protein